MNNNIENNILKIYNKLIFSEIKEYIDHNIQIQYNIDHINNVYDYISNINNKKSFIKFIQLNHSSNYDIQFLSTLFYHEYLQWAVPNITSLYPNIQSDDINNSNNMISDNIDDLYNLISYKNNLKNAIKYYDETDKDYANYIRSLSCITWILRAYQDILINNDTFNSWDEDKLKELLTPELKEELKEKLENCKDEDYKWTKDEDENLQNIYYYMRYNDTENEYADIFEQYYYSCDCGLKDLSRIIYYIYDNNLDIYQTLLTLAGDYRYAMYKVKPVKPGIQSTACMILDDLDYDYSSKIERTPEIQVIIDDVYGIKTDLYLKDFKHSFDILLKLFRREFDKHLIWGANGLF
jgi:hypothetical protein